MFQTLTDLSDKTAFAEEQSSETKLVTHFFQLSKSILDIPGGATFITKNVDGKSLFTLGINQSDNFKTSQNAIYPINLVFSENFKVKPLRDLDLRQFALSGSRVLDFEFIGKNKFGINAVISLSRNQGGVFFSAGI